MTYDDFILALTVWREARGEPYNAKLGVANVIHNRVGDGRWKKTIHETCLQRSQFSSFLPGDVNVTKFPKISNTADWSAWKECCKAAADPNNVVGPATHYHDISIPTPWLDMQFTRQIGHLKFFYEPVKR
mgnify:CR=1 FL=1